MVRLRTSWFAFKGLSNLRFDKIKKQSK
jgi:hypothetical protein